MARREHASVAIVGGGIAGLAAAWFLTEARPDLAVTVCEGSPTVGGKIAGAELAGVPIDVGAEAMLNRRPEAVELARAIGLSEHLRYPATTTSRLWIGGQSRPIPGGTVMGIPSDPEAVADSGVLSAEGLAAVRADADKPVPAPGERKTPDDEWDASVGGYVAERVGQEVVDRLVEPLLGGVYAGNASELSLRSTVPQLRVLATRLEGAGSLVRQAQVAVRAAARPDTGYPPPVFAGLEGGVSRLPDTLRRTLTDRGVRIRTETMVRGLQRRSDGWRLELGATARPVLLDCSAVIVASPARSAGRLLADAAPHAALELAAMEYASVATVAFAFSASAFPGGLDGSGLLVPRSEGRFVKAVTFATRKWPWLAQRADGLEVVRCSVGRHRDEASLQYDDTELAERALVDLRAMTGVEGEPVDSLVTRWGGGLPQYLVGHGRRVERIRDELDRLPDVAVCGAAYDGIGIPACVATARSAAEKVAAAFGAASGSERSAGPGRMDA